MGSLSSKPLHSWTSEDVAGALAGLGPKYFDYGAAAQENGVDGDLLVSMTETETSETMEDLGIEKRLHRRVILKKLNDLKLASQTPLNPPPPAEKCQAEAVSRNSVVAKFLEVQKENELDVFDDIILQALERTSPIIVYAGIHLIREEGALVLAGSLQKKDQRLPMPRFFLQPHEVSLCSFFVRETEENYLEMHIPQKLWGSDEQPFKYSGYIVKDEQGNRRGSVCIMDVVGDQCCSEEKEAMLQELAAEAERQLQERDALIEREASLQAQIQSANPGKNQTYGEFFSTFLSGDTETAEALSGALSRHADHASMAAGAETAENSLKGTSTRNVAGPKGEDGRGANEATDADSYEFDTSTAPEFQIGRATKDEMPHLRSDFFDYWDSAGLRRPPIAKDDMQSVAAAEELNLHAITPESKIGQKIKKLVSMAARMFDFPLANLYFYDQEIEHGICVHTNGDQIRELLERIVTVKLRNNDGTPYSYSIDRGPSMCNYTLFKKKTFVVKDLSRDKAFAMTYKSSGIQAYVGCPLVDDANRVIGNICLMDFRARPDFTQMCEVQLEQIGCMVLQEIQNWSMQTKIAHLEEERTRLLAMASSTKKQQPPKGEATIVLTDVEGSTSLWEKDCQAMQTALEMHDTVIRERCMEYNGYEIDTEGDAFFIAFHDPVDAIAFALSVQQELYEAPWDDDILTLAEACEEKKAFRGLQVRMGIHHGQVNTTVHGVTKRMDYSGPAWNLTKSVEAMAHGGQILTTMETWSLASSLGERSIGPYQVVDLGTHVMQKGEQWDEGVVSKTIVQLVPESLSFDYFKARRQAVASAGESDIAFDETRATLLGRQFPPPITKRQVGPSFHDAPYQGNKATIMFMSTSEAEKAFEEFQDTRATLVRRIGELLISYGRGYHCHSLMTTFNQPSDAVLFGFKYLQSLRELEQKSGEDGIKLSRLVKFGCIQGQFLCMGPHKCTGRADYFGKVVNRAARVAGAAAPGTIYLGVSGQNTKAPVPGPGFDASLVGVKPLKGVQEEITLYECHSFL